MAMIAAVLGGKRTGGALEERWEGAFWEAKDGVAHACEDEMDVERGEPGTQHDDSSPSLVTHKSSAPGVDSSTTASRPSSSRSPSAPSLVAATLAVAATAPPPPPPGEYGVIVRVDSGDDFRSNEELQAIVALTRRKVRSLLAGLDVTVKLGDIEVGIFGGTAMRSWDEVTDSSWSRGPYSVCRLVSRVLNGEVTTLLHEGVTAGLANPEGLAILYERIPSDTLLGFTETTGAVEWSSAGALAIALRSVVEACRDISLPDFGCLQSLGAMAAAIGKVDNCIARDGNTQAHASKLLRAFGSRLIKSRLDPVLGISRFRWSHTECSSSFSFRNKSCAC